MTDFEAATAAAAYIRERMKEPPGLCVVLGSGLGSLAGRVVSPVRLPYKEIPGFPELTLRTQSGQLLLGRLGDKPAAVMAGRFHYYEGHSFEALTRYVRVMHLLGVNRLLITNAAGGVNPTFRTGEFMLIRDHIKLFSDSPARGAGFEDYGFPRFFDMSHTYSAAWRQLAREAARGFGIPLRDGVYFYMPGPQFETPAEIRAIRAMGGDAVGMSTVPEVIAAAQCGMEVLGISCITNPAAGVVPERRLSDEEVNEAAVAVADRFCDWVEETVRRTV